MRHGFTPHQDPEIGFVGEELELDQAALGIAGGPELLGGVLEQPLRRRINRCNAADVALLDHVRTSFSETVERVQDYIAEGARGARH